MQIFHARMLFVNMGDNKGICAIVHPRMNTVPIRNIHANFHEDPTKTVGVAFYGQTEGRTDRRTERWTDRQMDRHG